MHTTLGCTMRLGLVLRSQVGRFIQCEKRRFHRIRETPAVSYDPWETYQCLQERHGFIGIAQCRAKQAAGLPDCAPKWPPQPGKP